MPAMEDEESMKIKWIALGKVGQLAALLLIAGLISVATVATIVIATNQLEGDFRPEVALPILLVSGLIALVAALAILVGTFSIFGLTQPGSAFGLPEGTLQAVIAMMIIMIFAITSLYLNASVKTTTLKSVVTQAQLADIPSDEIQSITPREDESGNQVEDESGNQLFDVQRVVANRVGEDFAKQLLTTLSTLVVAVVAFYFGAKSVETGGKLPRIAEAAAVTPAGPPEPAAAEPGAAAEEAPAGSAAGEPTDAPQRGDREL